MEFIKKNKKYLILGGSILLVLIASLIIYNIFFNNDGMNNKGIYNLKYRVYQNGKWSKYSKNGMTVGDKEHPIENLSLKYKGGKGKVQFDLFDTAWYGYSDSIPNEENVSGLSVITTGVLSKKYDVCFRTYNKKDKWLNWSCNGEYNGNRNEVITALEIKIIPKGTIKFDYLRDYNKTLDTLKNF